MVLPETEFDSWIGTSGKGTNAKKTMTLSVPHADLNKANPLHANLLNSPVIALGNGQVLDQKAKALVPLNHGYNGDVYPILDDSNFYVMTSYKLTEAEQQQYCGPNANLEECDKFLDALIVDKKVFYWIFAVNKAMIHVHPSAAKKSKPDVTITAAAVTSVEEQHDDERDDEPSRSSATKKKTTRKR